MDINTAKGIVGDMVRVSLSFVLNDENPTIIKRLKEYSLSDLISANELVGNCEKDSRIDENGNKIITHHLTLDDRVIAAIYVMINYEGQDASDCNAIVQFKNKGVYVVK